MSGSLTIAVLADSAEIFPLLGQYLDAERYSLQYFTSHAEFLTHVDALDRDLDCLIFYSDRQLLPVINDLYTRGLILPVVILQGLRSARSSISESTATATTLAAASSYTYQPSEVILAVTEMSNIGVAIDKAIAKFLNLTPVMSAADDAQPTAINVAEPNYLRQQQRRLSEKLNERLGYLAVYYKRNPQQFFRYLDRQQKQRLLSELKSQYRKIVLDYFADMHQLNDRIDEFVSSAFFSDLAVSEIVKIHMELMEEFSDQLKLEGRSEEILLDYRLTLIDIIAHLCEMYRRSIPREV